MEMRSYETARTVHSILGFFAWSMVIGGILIAIGGAGATSQFVRGGGIMGALPGLVITVFGLLTLANVQNARAAVDTAELSQHILKVARDQLEVSKQSLKQQASQPQTFEAAVNKTPEPARASFSTQSAEVKAPAEKKEEFSYRGHRVRVDDNLYLYDGTKFPSMETVKIHIDRVTGVSNRDEGRPAFNRSAPLELTAAEKVPAREPALEEQQITKGLVDGELEYKGRTILVENGKFHYANMAFLSLEGAQKYIDQVGGSSSVELPGVTRKL